MNAELKNAIKATDSKAEYDTSAKRLLGQKSILAHILVKTPLSRIGSLQRMTTATDRYSI